MPIFDVVLKRLTIRGSIVWTRMDLAEAIHVRRRGNRGKGPCALPRGPPRGRQPSPSRICGQDTSTAGSCFGSPEGRGRRWRPRKASKPTTQGRSRAGRPSPLTPRRRLACSRSRCGPVQFSGTSDALASPRPSMPRQEGTPRRSARRPGPIHCRSRPPFARLFAISRRSICRTPLGPAVLIGYAGERDSAGSVSRGSGTNGQEPEAVDHVSMRRVRMHGALRGIRRPW